MTFHDNKTLIFSVFFFVNRITELNFSLKCAPYIIITQIRWYKRVNFFFLNPGLFRALDLLHLYHKNINVDLTLSFDISLAFIIKMTTCITSSYVMYKGNVRKLRILINMTQLSFTV